MKKWIVLCAGLALAGCSGDGVDVTTPSNMHAGKIVVRDEMATVPLPAASVDREQVAVLARRILNGDGKASLTVPYHQGAQAAAEKTGQDYVRAFAAEGVTALSVAPVLVSGGAPADKVVLAFGTKVASTDDTCHDMPGAGGAATLREFDDYKFRCATQDAQSRMVANPGDLLGRGGTRDGDSRRAGAVIENFASGKPAEKLQGMAASSASQ